MISKRVACGLAFLANRANLSCIAIYFAMRDLCLLNLDGGRNNGNPYMCSAKSIEIRIQHVASSGNRKIKLLARTRMRSVRRCEIYVLRVGPILSMLVDDFDAKSSSARRDEPGRIRKSLKYTNETLRRLEKDHPEPTGLRCRAELLEFGCPRQGIYS